VARLSADFFELQDEARRGTTRLVLLYLAAVLGVAGSLGLVVAAAYALFVLYWGGPLPEGLVLDYTHLTRSYFQVLTAAVPPRLYYSTSAVALAVMVAASLWRIWQLREGGESVAELMGARRIERQHASAMEARLLNVTEEMAIAAGIAVPVLFVLDGESAINALAAGYAPDEAVIIVTQGALNKLTRDELQGVIAHEFSHILNGDIRLNLRLIGLLYGIAAIGQTAHQLMRTDVSAVPLTRAERIGAIEGFVAGGLLSLIGYFGLFAARLIKAAISREREYLADAASVQFTRNPDGIAGALDSTRSLHLGTFVRNAHAEETSHMFFGQAVGDGLGPSFATHPPLDDRIRRVHPRFSRDEYRATREGLRVRREVAVLDGQGNVVKTIIGSAPEAGTAAGLLASVGQPRRAHLDAAARLIASLPASTRERLKTPAGASQVVFALALDEGEAARRAELAVLSARRGAAFALETQACSVEIGWLARSRALPLAELALPVLKELRRAARDALIADLGAVVEADGRVSLAEFVLFTYMRQRLRPGAGRPIGTRIARIEDVAADLRVVLSLIAHCSSADPAFAFARAADALGFDPGGVLAKTELSGPSVGRALERLRVLAPLAKPRVLKACFDVTLADGRLNIAEAELVRIVAASMECPLPAYFAAQDPTQIAR